MGVRLITAILFLFSFVALTAFAKELKEGDYVVLSNKWMKKLDHYEPVPVSKVNTDGSIELSWRRGPARFRRTIPIGEFSPLSKKNESVSKRDFVHLDKRYAEKHRMRRYKKVHAVAEDSSIVVIAHRHWREVVVPPNKYKICERAIAKVNGAN